MSLAAAFLPYYFSREVGGWAGGGALWGRPPSALLAYPPACPACPSVSSPALSPMHRPRACALHPGPAAAGVSVAPGRVPQPAARGRWGARGGRGRRLCCRPHHGYGVQRRAAAAATGARMRAMHCLLACTWLAAPPTQPSLNLSRRRRAERRDTHGAGAASVPAHAAGAAWTPPHGPALHRHARAPAGAQTRGRRSGGGHAARPATRLPSACLPCHADVLPSLPACAPPPTQGELYLLAQPGGPRYAPRRVNRLALGTLDALFPAGRRMRRAISLGFRFFHPQEWPWYWWDFLTRLSAAAAAWAAAAWAALAAACAGLVRPAQRWRGAARAPDRPGCD